jgi:hypothetical protein
MRLVVAEITKAHAHVPHHRTGNGDGNADAKDGVRDGERIQVPVAKKNQAGGESPNECQRRQDRIGQMRESKQARCRKGG